VEDDLEMDMVNDDRLGGTRRRRATTSTTELYSVDDLPRVTHLNDSEVCAAHLVTISKKITVKITISIVDIFVVKYTMRRGMLEPIPYHRGTHPRLPLPHGTHLIAW